MEKRAIVAVQISKRVKKYIHMEAIRRETTIGSIMGEACLAWIKFLRKVELEERMKNNDPNIETLKAELIEIQSELVEVLKYRKATKNKTRPMKKEPK